VMMLNASENARKTAESKLKQFDEQVNILASHGFYRATEAA